MSHPLVLDLDGIAKLIDVAAVAGPGRLKTLLQVLRTSEESLEARVVVELALRCRDPLAPLATRCRDALQTALDFHRLLASSPWRGVRDVCPNARAVALRNLCDEALANVSPYQQARREKCRELRPRLEAAAAVERAAHAGAIEAAEALRDRQCPGYRRLLRTFLTQVIADRAAF